MGCFTKETIDKNLGKLCLSNEAAVVWAGEKIEAYRFIARQEVGVITKTADYLQSLQSPNNPKKE